MNPRTFINASAFSAVLWTALILGFLAMTGCTCKPGQYSLAYCGIETP